MLVPPALIWRTGRTGSCNGDTNGLMHETVKEPAMPSPLLRLGSLALLFGLIALGGPADAKGQAVTVRQKPAGDGGADAARGARDQDDAALRCEQLVAHQKRPW